MSNNFWMEENTYNTRRVSFWANLEYSFTHFKANLFKANLPYCAGAKKYQKALNIQWFYIKIYFFVFDNYLHNMCIKYHELIN